MHASVCVGVQGVCACECACVTGCTLTVSKRGDVIDNKTMSLTPTIAYWVGGYCLCMCVTPMNIIKRAEQHEVMFARCKVHCLCVCIISDKEWMRCVGE